MIKKKHNYQYDVDLSSESAAANVIRMVGLHKHVLEIGCGPGSITRILKSKNQCRLTGIEIDPEAIEIVKPYCEKVIQADLNASHWPDSINEVGPFDVVVAADVLEHLYDPWTTLKRMLPFISSDGYFVISLPHVGHATIMACLWTGDFEYREWGLLDQTHIRFFGLKNIDTLFSAAGLKIIEVKYVVKPPEETEFSAIWSSLSSEMKKAFQSSSYSNIYQVVVKAVPFDREGKKVPLVAPMFQPRACFKDSLSIKRIGDCLSPHIKKCIRNSLSVLGIKK